MLKKYIVFPVNPQIKMIDSKGIVFEEYEQVQDFVQGNDPRNWAAKLWMIFEYFGSDNYQYIETIKNEN